MGGDLTGLWLLAASGELRNDKFTRAPQLPSQLPSQRQLIVSTHETSRETLQAPALPRLTESCFIPFLQRFFQPSRPSRGCNPPKPSFQCGLSQNQRNAIGFRPMSVGEPTPAPRWAGCSEWSPCRCSRMVSVSFRARRAHRTRRPWLASTSNITTGKYRWLRT